MSTSSRLRVVLVATILTVAGLATPASAATLTTAWQNGAFQLDRHAVVSRSNIVLGAPNSAATQSLPGEEEEGDDETCLHAYPGQKQSHQGKS